MRARRPGTGLLDYRCIYHATRGAAVCANSLSLPLQLANPEILGRLQRDVLTPERIERAITRALDAYAAETASAPASEAALRRDLARLDEECARLAGAIATGAALPSLLAALAERERTRAARQAELAALQGLTRAAGALDRGGLRAEIRGWLAEWQGLLEEEPAQARQVLRKLFASRLVWTPRQEADGAYYDYRVEVAYGRLLAGVVGVKSVVPPG